MVKIFTIRLLITLAIAHHWHINQLDISNAFLHGDLQETIYMEQSPSFQNPLFTATPCSSFSFMNISSEPIDPHLCRSTVGAVQYLTLTCPNIQFVVNRACQKMHLPQPVDWQQVKHLLCYLKGTITEGLKVSRTFALHISLYSDADWAGSSDDR